MSTYTQHVADLSEETVDRLNDLIQINLDSAKGFRTAAENVDVATYASLFKEMADQRQAQAEELQAQVIAEGERPETNGSFAGQAHRWWLSLREKVSGSEAYAVLAEAERGEDAIKDMYEKIVGETAGSPLHELLSRQQQQVIAGHNRIRDLRDREKDAKDRD